ncbi:MAG: PDZ domain-containing protein [Akkermansiaceae bacterium]
MHEAELPRTELIGLTMMPDSRAVVAGICCHTPGGAAGLMGGDQILEVDGKKIQSNREFRRALFEARRKRSIKIVVAVSFIKMNGVNPTRTVTINLPEGWSEKAQGRR